MKTFIFFTAILTISLTRLSETDGISSNYREIGVHAMPEVVPININETLWLKKKYGINLLRLGCLNTQQEVRAVDDQNATSRTSAFSVSGNSSVSSYSRFSSAL